MKKTLTLLIVLLIAILFGWLWRGEQRQEISPINEVSFKADDELKPPPAAKPSQPSLPAPEVLAEPNREPETVRENKQFSYLRVYRLYRSLLYCSRFVHYQTKSQRSQEQQAWSVETALRIHLDSSNKLSEAEFSDVQREYFGRYFEQCKVNLANIEVFLELDKAIDSYNAFEVTTELFQSLLKYPAKTDKEKKIKQALNSITHWFASAEAVLFIYEQATDTLSDEQLAQLEAEIVELEQGWRQETNPELSKLYYRQIERRRNLLFSQKHLEEGLKEQLWDAFEQATSQLHAQLTGQDPDVLFEVAQASALPSLFRKMLFAKHDGYYENYYYYSQNTQKIIRSKADIHSMLQRQTHIQESILVKSATYHAWDLYYCHLGGDCGSQSDIMTSMCVGKLLNNDYFPEGCGMNMTDFYIGRLISPNRLQDVLFFFDLLVKKYGS